MTEILKFGFNWITDSYSLFENPLYDYFVMAAIGTAALAIAWGIVGDLYDSRIIVGSLMGKIFHWPIRLLAFTVIFLMTSALFRLISFIISIPTWFWVTMLLVIIVSITIFAVYKIRTLNQE